MLPDTLASGSQMEEEEEEPAKETERCPEVGGKPRECGDILEAKRRGCPTEVVVSCIKCCQASKVRPKNCLL